MDYLFNNIIINQTDKYYITCYYIVDDNLRYVSIKDCDMFYLHYVDTDEIGESFEESNNEGDLDYKVIELNSPILSQTSTIGNINNKDIRIVKTVTVSGNNRIIKPKQSSDRNIIKRYKSNQNKLF
jgi:hypothetical protein